MRHILIIGDTHIPNRAKEIPNKIKTYIKDFSNKIHKFDKVFCTGDIVESEEFINFLYDIDKSEPLIVQGNMDFYKGVYNPNELIYSFEDIPEINFGLIHGHQIKSRGDYNQLYNYSKRMGNIQILISGHTHDDFVVLKGKDLLLLNPGSSVGAWSFVASGIPSFIILEIERKNDDEVLIRVNRFKLKDDKLKEDKYEYLFANRKFTARLF